MKEAIAIIEGVRTPMGKAGGILSGYSADDLGSVVVREVLRRSGIDKHLVDEVIIGNVAQPMGAANIARVIALKAGLPMHVTGLTVHRNCASGMEAITNGVEKIQQGRSQVIIAGGTESMSHIPLVFNREMTALYQGLYRDKTLWLRAKRWMTFRPRYLKPVISLLEGLTDPICGMLMGQTAEVLAREFGISRDEQDAYALMSHKRATQATRKGVFAGEVMPLMDLNKQSILMQDEGPRADQSLEALRKLKPYFDRKNGTVTVGNACPVTDGACALLLMKASLSKKLKVQPLGYIRGYSYASLEPHRMGLGPAYAFSRLMKTTRVQLKDYHLIELNEAFAAQVIANIKAFDSRQFAQKYLGRSRALGSLKPSRMNVNGGAIALGHPVGMTGARLVLHLIKELRRRRKHRGLATLCVGGGQGAAIDVEINA